MVQCLLENSRQFPVYVINDGHSYVINILTFWSKGKHILILLTVDYITLHYMWWIGSECFATSNCLLGVVFLRTRIVTLSIQERLMFVPSEGRVLYFIYQVQLADIPTCMFKVRHMLYTCIRACFLGWNSLLMWIKRQRTKCIILLRKITNCSRET